MEWASQDHKTRDIGLEMILDLGGTRKGSSLEIFKRGWGGIELEIPEKKRWYKRFRFLIGFMPLWVLKRSIRK